MFEKIKTHWNRMLSNHYLYEMAVTASKDNDVEAKRPLRKYLELKVRKELQK